MSARRTTRRTLEQRRQGRTDWSRVDAMSEAEIDANAARDPDNGLWTEEQLRAASLLLPAEQPKEAISLRVDREILDYFRSQGPGYQTRINAVLRAYVRGIRT